MQAHLFRHAGTTQYQSQVLNIRVSKGSQTCTLICCTMQGSPNMANPNKETFRHAISVTAWRPGLKGTPYLYTLNLSCPDEAWDKYGQLYQQAAESFKLLDPSKVDPPCPTVPISFPPVPFVCSQSYA